MLTLSLNSVVEQVCLELQRCCQDCGESFESDVMAKLCAPRVGRTATPGGVLIGVHVFCRSMKSQEAYDKGSLGHLL